MTVGRRRVACFIAAFFAVSAFFSSPPVRAHVGAYVLTTIVWNADSGTLEVVHRIHTHHAQDAASLQLGGGPATFDDLKSLAALGLYTETRFAIAALNEEPIPLEFIGAEPQGDYILVYQEAAYADEPAGLRVKNDLLADVFRNQVNQVNVSLKGQALTLTFGKTARNKFLTATAD
ncbi:MAG: DUF6702 family protein [Pseudomonadota bacterium]